MRAFLARVGFRGSIGERSVEPYLRLFAGLAARRRVRGVLFEITSGGGEAVASSDLHLALRRLDAVKPVFSAIGGIAASGGYLAALGARRVFAYPESLVGSIGVVYPHLAARELLRRLGISVELLHVGEHKDAFQGYRPLTDEERTKQLAVARASYDQFVARVAEARRRPVEEVRRLATGEVWSGRDAVGLGLVDALADRETALAELARATGMPPGRVVRLAPPRPFHERLFAPGVAAHARAGATELRDALADGVLEPGLGSTLR